MGGISVLDFELELGFQSLVKLHFCSTVSSISNASGFFMVASFCQSALWINSESTALFLQACLGGTAEDFMVLWLKDWCFHFTACSKEIGLMIHRMRKVFSDLFAIHFTIWRYGGSDYVKEHQLWERSQAVEWHLINHSKNRKSHADTANSSGAMLVFSRLHFPDNYYITNYKNHGDAGSTPMMMASLAKMVDRPARDQGRKLHGHIQNSNFA